jgi:uncharacterized RDD family membrane protein YckC
MEYEDTVRIATPEGVELELPLAGIGSRLTARILDHLLQAAIAIATLFIFSSSVDTESSGEAFVAIIGTLIFFAIFWVYDVVFEAFAGGRTPGKRAVGIRVVGNRGEPIGFPAAAVRNLLRFVDEYLTLWIVALVSILRSERNQRVGDMAAGTMVVRERSSEAGADVAIGVAHLDDLEQAQTWDTTAVTDAELAAARRFLERRYQVDPAARIQLATDLRDRLQPKVSGSGGVRSAEQFVEILVAVKARRG